MSKCLVYCHPDHTTPHPRSTVPAKQATPSRTTRTATPRRTPPAKPKTPLIDHARGERLFVLEVPYDERQLANQAGGRWETNLGWIYIGTALPHALTRYRPRPYTWAAWEETEHAGGRRGNPAPTTDNGSFTLRTDQHEDTRTILAAHRAGVPEFLIASLTGVGKTVTAIAAAKQLPGVSTILVIGPVTSLAGWRNHLKDMGDGGKRWVLINPESAKNLLAKPAAKINAKTGKPVKSSASSKNRQHARDGQPKVAWDLVIVDESHLLANPSSQRSIAIDRIIEGPGTKPAFVMRLSATAGSNPAQLSYLHRGLAYVSGEKPLSKINMDAYAAWCQKRGVAVSASKKYGTEQLVWEKNERDLLVFNKLIFGTRPQWACRRKPEGWPEQKRILVPVELNLREMDAYEAAWEEFQEAMRELKKADGTTGAAARAARTKGLAAQIRYRQKAGIIRAPHSADYALDLHDKGYQVAISCEFLGAAEAIREHLTSKGHAVSEFTGANQATREEERVAFQQGKTKFIIFTPDSSFSLHQGESIVGGNNTPRALVVAQPRWSPLKTLQVEGRTQRNGREAFAHYPFAAETIEEKVLRASLAGVEAMATLNGDDPALIRAANQSLRNVAVALGAPVLDERDL
jgi:hypothetical protein